ncbi:hypothetical protein C8J95_10534 [Elizabethkingia sp. YR214]|nr:hypothetical protein C8J95_10534 [Elizabethkingia sp. YR214]
MVGFTLCVIPISKDLKVNVSFTIKASIKPEILILEFSCFGEFPDTFTNSLDR